MYVLPQRRMAVSPRGLSGASPQQINSIVTTGASATLGILAGLHAVIGGVALAGPVGAAIAAGIAVASLVANLIVKEFSGCGDTCIIASKDADKYGALAQQNLAGYMALPIRYASLQAAYLNNFDTLKAALQAACSDPALGAAGQRCISERLVKGNPAPWCPTKTGCDWITTLRDPIANDPNVVPDPTPVSQVSDAGSSALSSLGINPSTTIFGLSLGQLALPAGLILLALMLPSGKD